VALSYQLRFPNTYKQQSRTDEYSVVLADPEYNASNMDHSEIRFGGMRWRGVRMRFDELSAAASVAESAEQVAVSAEEVDITTRFARRSAFYVHFHLAKRSQLKCEVVPSGVKRPDRGGCAI
jgi:hypothetical protein